MAIIPYIINSFRGGVSEESDRGVEGSFKHGHALDIHKREDTLSCKQAMTTVFDANNTTITGLIQFLVPATDGSTYAFSSTGSIYARSGDGDWNFVYNDENGNIKGAAEWKFSDDNNYLFWATDTSIARKPLIGAGMGASETLWSDATQDWKTTLDGAEWHAMRIASGSLMIPNGNFLAEVDFDGNFDPSALNIRPGNLIKTLEERDDYVILGSYRKDESEEGHIWSWITTALNWVQKKKVPIKGVNALITAEFPLLQGGSDGEIFLADFGDPQPLHGVPGGGQVYPDGVSIEDDIAVFGVFGGTYPGIWSYGRKRKNRPLALNFAYRLAQGVNGSTISTIGAVKMVNGELLASWGTTDGSTSEYGIDQVSSTTKATALYEGLEFDGGSPHLKKKFDTVKIVTAPLPASCSYSIKFRQNRATTGGDSSAGAGWKYAVLGDGSTTYSVEDSVEAEFHMGVMPLVYEVGIELNPSDNASPEVLDIVTYLGEETYEHG